MATRTEPGGTGQVKPARIESLDVYRALAILAVVGIHVLGHFLPVWQGMPVWAPAALANRALQFAVPAFLTLSAFLNLRPLLRGEDLGRFAKRRVLRALWPYAVWTLLYALFRSWERSEPLEPARVLEWLWTGNAYYHLYFLLLILQLYIMLPLLALWFRKRPKFALVAVAAVVLQVGIYVLNRRTLWLSSPESPLSPGSVILWYLPSVLLGCWLAPRSGHLKETVHRGLPAALFITVASALVYLPLAFRVLAERPVNTAAYQISLWAYAPAATFLLLALSERLTGSALRRVLDPVGARSLEIYLVHPLVIWALDQVLPAGLHSGLALPLYFAACVLAPMAFAWLLGFLRLSRLAWGTEGK